MYNNEEVIQVLLTFLHRFEHDDPFFTEFIRKNDELNEAIGTGLLADFFPIFKYIPTKGVRLLKEVSQFMLDLVEGTYKEHENTYDDCECE